MEVFAVWFWIGVAVVAVRIIIGGDDVSGSRLSGVSFEDDSDDNIWSVGPGDGDAQDIT